MSRPDPQLLALLRRCKEEPDDPQPRRILGDWLEEHGTGQPQAVLANLLRQPETPWTYFLGSYLEMDPDFRETAAACSPGWLGRLAEGRDWNLERGLFGLKCSTAELAAGLPTPPLPGGWAWVGQLVVTGLAHLDGRLRLPPFEGLLCGERSGDGLTVLQADDGLERLTGLDLESAHLGAESNRQHFRRLCEIPFDALAHLDLGANSLGAEHLDQLVRSPAGRRLRIVNLEGNAVGDQGMMMLAEAECAGSLRVLELSEVGMRTAGMQALAWSPARNLRWLSLTGNRGIGVDGLLVALEEGFTAHLEYACLAYLDLGDAMCRALAASPMLTRLTRLDVSGDAAMTLDGVRRLIESPNLHGLTWLGIPTRLKQPAEAAGLRRDGLYLA